MDTTHIFSATEYVIVLLQIKVHIFLLSHADSDFILFFIIESS